MLCRVASMSRNLIFIFLLKLPLLLYRFHFKDVQLIVKTFLNNRLSFNLNLIFILDSVISWYTWILKVGFGLKGQQMTKSQRTSSHKMLLVNITYLQDHTMCVNQRMYVAVWYVLLHHVKCSCWSKKFYEKQGN